MCTIARSCLKIDVCPRNGTHVNAHKYVVYCRKATLNEYVECSYLLIYLLLSSVVAPDFFDSWVQSRGITHLISWFLEQKPSHYHIKCSCTILSVHDIVEWELFAICSNYYIRLCTIIHIYINRKMISARGTLIIYT